MPYKKNELRELSTLYNLNININTLISRNQSKGKIGVDLLVISKICETKKISLKEFNHMLTKREQIKSAKITLLTKMLIKEKKDIKMEDDLNLNIEIESDDVTWLKDGNTKLMGYENIDHLIDELDGVIEIDDDFKIHLIDEEKLTEKILFI